MASREKRGLVFYPCPRTTGAKGKTPRPSTAEIAGVDDGRRRSAARRSPAGSSAGLASPAEPLRFTRRWLENIGQAPPRYRGAGGTCERGDCSNGALFSHIARCVLDHTLYEPMQDEAYRDYKACPRDDEEHSDDPQDISSSDSGLPDEDDRISHDGQAGRWKA